MSDGRPPIQGYVDPNFPNPGTDQDAPIIIYGYTPSLVVALLGVILFAIASLCHGFQVLKYRTWYFIPVLIGTLMEVVGYCFRILSNRISPYNIIYFVVQYFFIVVAPVFFSAAIYTILSILINVTDRSIAPLPPRVILWVFITCDVVATGVQVAGAALIGAAQSNRRDPTTANNILLGGLAFQVFTFLVFVVLLALFLARAARAGHLRGLRAFVASTCAASAAIYLRTCFRLAETAEGLQGGLSTREVYFGTLEFAPVVVAVFLFVAWHPGRCVPQRKRPGAKGPRDISP